MYAKIEDLEDVTLNSYLDVYRVEEQDKDACILHVICQNDKMYSHTVDMNNFAIDRKKVYG